MQVTGLKPGVQPGVKESPNQRSAMQKEETHMTHFAIPGLLKYSPEDCVNIKVKMGS